MAKFNGQLNTNEIFSTIYNMIIRQTVFSENIAGTFSGPVDRAREEGSMFGDTILYYSTDALFPKTFVPDSEEQLNLLKTHRPKDPEVQSLTIDVFKYIPLTTDNYFTKRAFSTPSVFADFNSTLIKWLYDTKRIYDATTYNTYIGTTETAKGEQLHNVNLASITPSVSTTDEEAYNRITAQTIAEDIGNLLVDISDVSRDFNDYGYIRSYALEDVVILWNSRWYNSITKLDLPTIFHDEGIMDKMDRKDVLPARYFGDINASGGTVSAANTSIRTLIPVEIDENTKLFPGDLLPDGYQYQANTTYTVKDNIVCKIMAKGSVPYMSGFETQTEFINAKNLSENRYLIFGHNTLEYLKEKPFITVKAITT